MSERMPDAYWKGLIGARVRSDLGEKMTKDVLNTDVAGGEKFVSITDLYQSLLKRRGSPTRVANLLKPYWEPKGLSPGSKCWFLTRCTNLGEGAEKSLTKFCAVKTNKYEPNVRLGQTYVYSDAAKNPNAKAYLATLLFKNPYECALNLSEILEIASFGRRTNLQDLKDKNQVKLEDISQRDFKIRYDRSEKQFIYQSVNGEGEEISGSKNPCITTQYPIGEITSEAVSDSSLYLGLIIGEREYPTRIYSPDEIAKMKSNFGKEMESYF